MKTCLFVKMCARVCNVSYCHRETKVLLFLLSERQPDCNAAQIFETIILIVQKLFSPAVNLQEGIKWLIKPLNVTKINAYKKVW